MTIGRAACLGKPTEPANLCGSECYISWVYQLVLAMEEQGMSVLVSGGGHKCVGVYVWLTETPSTKAPPPNFLLVFYNCTTFMATLLFAVNPSLTSTEKA